ncbi:MAG: ATP-binding cassette domain-containing protein [Janthinobacterium sp.]
MTATAELQQWALQAQDLSYAYPGTAPVFQHVSLGVRKREIVCLLGGSGCGKSSLLRVLAGLQSPSTGAIQFLDAPMREPDPRSALVFQQASLLPWLNVTGNAGFGLDFKHQPQLTRAAHEARVAQAIEAVGLKGREKLYPSALSGGMAQRVALARALAREPELLFADEPTGSLDAATGEAVIQLMFELNRERGSTLVLVTHDSSIAARCGRTITIAAGRLV